VLAEASAEVLVAILGGIGEAAGAAVVVEVGFSCDAFFLMKKKYPAVKMNPNMLNATRTKAKTG